MDCRLVALQPSLSDGFKKSCDLQIVQHVVVRIGAMPFSAFYILIGSSKKTSLFLFLFYLNNFSRKKVMSRQEKIIQKKIYKSKHQTKKFTLNLNVRSCSEQRKKEETYPCNKV